MQKTVRELFGKIGARQSLGFIYDLTNALEENGIKPKERKIAYDLLLKARKSFAQVSPEQAVKILKVYQEDLTKEDGSFNVYLVNVLLGTARGEHVQARQVIGLLVKSVLICPLPEEGREEENRG